jgi:glycosyltransferase involved in cell wall biosynthesis
MRLIGVNRLHYRGAGAESVHLDHLMLFRSMGWTCAEFAMQDPRNEPSPWSDYFPAGFDPDEGGLLHKIKQVGRFIHSTEARENFTRLLDDFKPDIIHIHALYHHLTSSVLKPAVERGIPIVYTLHDYKLICPAYFFYTEKQGVCEGCGGGRQYRCLTRGCKGGPVTTDAVYALDGLVQWHSGRYRSAISTFVGPSRFIVDKFTEHGFPPEKLAYVPNFFETTDDVSDDHAEIARLRELHGRFVLFFGRLSSEKGINVLIDACARAGLPLVVVGDGPKREALVEQAARLGVTATFVGHQSGSQLWSHVQAATTVCLASVWYENAPKSLLEAQARGKVVVASAIGGLPEMIRDGDTGFLVPSGDAGALGAALTRVFDMPELELEAMGARARVFATTTFTRHRYYEGMCAIYDRLLGRSTAEANPLVLPVS